MPTGFQRPSEQKTDRFGLDSVVEPANCLCRYEKWIRPRWAIRRDQADTGMVIGVNSWFTIHSSIPVTSVKTCPAEVSTTEIQKQGSIVTRSFVWKIILGRQKCCDLRDLLGRKIYVNVFFADLPIVTEKKKLGDVDSKIKIYMQHYTRPNKEERTWV